MLIGFSRKIAETVLLVSFSLAQSGAQHISDQSASTAPKKILTPEQQVYQLQSGEWMERRHGLQAQAKAIFDAGMAAEKAGDCRDAKTTDDANVCFGNVLTAADRRLETFEHVIQDLQAPSPRMAGATEVPAIGIAGPVFTAEQVTAEFGSVEQIWRQYRTAACTAAFHQFDGGTGGPSFEAQCELKLTRDHMRELDLIYGDELRL
jgi:uncharacterized protein YecT (DUF1311 family)